MRKNIKGIRRTKGNYIHKIIIKEKPRKEDCFQLVVIQEISWYRKVFRKLRNFFVRYRWQKAQ